MKFIIFSFTMFANSVAVFCVDAPVEIVREMFTHNKEITTKIFAKIFGVFRVGGGFTLLNEQNKHVSAHSRTVGSAICKTICDRFVVKNVTD